MCSSDLDKELAFVVLHETMHKAFKHLTTWKKLHDESPYLANAACDYVINLQLVDMDKSQSVLAMPMRDGKPLGLVDEKYRGLNAKQVFDLLKQEQPDGEGGGGFDSHDWEGAQEQLLRWVRGDGRILPGLVRRRQAESDLLK